MRPTTASMARSMRRVGLLASAITRAYYGQRQLGNLAFEDGDFSQLARYALAIAGVPSALLQALTDQPTFGNKLVAFLCGDASVARSGYCIQLDGHAFERTLGGLEPFHQFLEGHSPLAPRLL